MLVLSILHSIFLTPKEVENLISGEEVDAIGVSVPVWYYQGNTSEPAEEVFCKYKLKVSDKKESVSTLKNGHGYSINFPKLSSDYKEQVLSKEQITTMSKEELAKWHKDNPKTSNVNDLVSEKEKTSFKQFVKRKQKGKMTNLIHCVELMSANKLLESMC